ncbi:MAG: DUF2125 domain-containing protein [Pseudomonadota bacterium]
MRLLLWIVAAVTVVWCGYWLVVSQSVKGAGTAWFTDRQAEGWIAEYDDLSVRGFPYRFDTVVENMMLADPDTGVAWSVPDFTVTAMAYRPNHIIALFPERQVFASPFETVILTKEDMRASVRFVPGPSLALDQATAQLAGIALTSDQGWEVTLDTGLAAIRRTPVAVDSYDIYFDAKGLRPNDALRLAVDAQNRLPDTFEAMTLDATVVFDAPWDRFAIERARPQPTAITLSSFDAKWGALELRAVGEATLDDRGIPEGTFTIKATNWREIVAIGEATGAIPAGAVQTVTRMLEVMAGLSGPANTIDVPVSFKSGFITVAGLPLGPAPRIRLR